MPKKAFTVIEIVFIVVIMGIIGYIATPKLLSKNNIKEASKQVLLHMKHTQQLALQDELYNPNEPDWYKKRWSIQFKKCRDSDDFFYIIFSNLDKGFNIDQDDEPATDPLNGRSLYNNGNCRTIQEKNSPNVLLTEKFDIQDTFTNTCGLGATLTFDKLGRLHGGNKELYSNLITDDCNITFYDSKDNNFTISIKKETGYIEILE
ncbi:MAG: Putative periplasmic ATP /GTP-binding protein [uncultured Campylobacterales bacterium]|uniref:Periplasmic ATP /GTP-binding protein n=1 Tax=uncultured Campylobacterales bacterium TaxID=352960 RepID=A0A6S6SBE9_9BACT|nr:MAG: Putative periplasmic ATP /GTP-binding protein [uncultured Campylobacterales bacterium]